MAADELWLTHGALLTPRGIVRGAVQIARGRIAAVRSTTPRGSASLDLSGAYLAPGFIDLHAWGDPAVVGRQAVKHGTTAFLSAIGPGPARRFVKEVAERRIDLSGESAACLGFHLEGPFLNPARGGALPRRWMRPPTAHELRALAHAAGRRVRLMTLAPELPGALSAIRWCVAHRVVASLGHSDADALTAQRAVDAGARTVTHVFNGMRPLHHRRSSLLDVALADARLTTMVIADGVHISPTAFRLLVRVKGAGGIALVTDSIREAGWDVMQRRGAYYTRQGVLAGSDLTMIGAVRNAVRFGGVSLANAVRMASEVPARLLGLARSRGTLEVGKRGDLVGFDRKLRVMVTVVGGRIVYER